MKINLPSHCGYVMSVTSGAIADADPAVEVACELCGVIQLWELVRDPIESGDFIVKPDPLREAIATSPMTRPGKPR